MRVCFFLVQVSLVFIGREKGRGGVRKWDNNAFPHPSLSPARERLSGVPTSNPSWTGAGAWEEVLGHASFFSLPTLAPLPRGRDSVEKAKQEKRSWSHRIVALATVREIWNPPGICMGAHLRVCSQPKITELAPQRGGEAVTWTVDYMSSHLAAGLGAAGGEKAQRQAEE